MMLAVVQIAQAKTVNVFHTSDVHGSYFSRQIGKYAAEAIGEENTERKIGGFAALTAMLKKEKTPYIMVDAGDMFQGTPEGIFSKGIASMEYMNKAGYSLAVPGNHEFDYSQQTIMAMAKKAKFPILAANLYLEGTNDRPKWVKPYIILKRAGVKIAFFGIMGQHTKTSSNPKNTEGLEIRNEIEESKKIVAEIKAKENPNAIICVVHLGTDEHFERQIIPTLPDYVTERCRSCTKLYPNGYPKENGHYLDERYFPNGIIHLGRAVPEVDVFLGGHHHTGLINGYSDTNPDKENLDHQQYYGEAYTNLMFADKAELEFNDETGKLEGVKMSLVPLWIEEYGEDKAVLKMNDKLRKTVDATMLEKAGYTEGELSFSDEGLDSKIGNWICDLTKEIGNAQMGFQNTRGIRVPLPKGEIKVGDIYKVMPFDNTIITMKMTGKALKRMFEESYQDEKVGMEVSGIKVEILPIGSDGKHDFRLYDDTGKLISDTDVYTIATNSYLAEGGNFGAAFKEEGTEKHDTKVGFREYMLESLKKGNLPEQNTGRYVRVDK